MKHVEHNLDYQAKHRKQQWHLQRQMMKHTLKNIEKMKNHEKQWAHWKNSAKYNEK